MCNRRTTLFAVLLTVIVAITGCNKPDDPNNGGNNSTPTTEGVYLGVIGFNESLFQKPISLLSSDTKEAFKSFIDDLAVDKGTGLYYADYTALKKLKSYAEPPQLKNVALVTFTDGLDNVSTSNSEMDPEGYGSISVYRTALHDKIMNETIHGFNVTAYTIGLRGQDVSDEQEFRTNLNMLASSPNNVFEVTNMNEALQRFSDIADALYSITVTTKLKIEVPGGYDENQVIRFTFDNVSDGANSIKYVEGTYKRTDNARLFENISYHGLSEGATSITSISQSGAYYWFEFENLTHENGNPISQADINLLQLWKKQGSGWQRDVEFEPGASTEITEDKSSALIMLVLDCTTSLGDDFTKMKTGAKQFVEILASSNQNNGGGNTFYAPVGAINGLFSITPNKQVFFSKGNLQYVGSSSSPYWKFAEEQWEFFGNNGQADSSPNVDRDLFCWGTSGWNCGNTYYHPWDFHNGNGNLFGPEGNHNLTDDYAKSDWGVYNAITNGGNHPETWRTLTKSEWCYIFETRATSSGIRYAKAQVNNVNGLIILPDDWNSSYFDLKYTNDNGSSFSSNVISSTTWINSIQSHGAVFLPASGMHSGWISSIGNIGCYWSTSYKNSSDAFCESFSEFGGHNNSSCEHRYVGLSVRLVQDY